MNLSYFSYQRVSSQPTSSSCIYICAMPGIKWYSVTCLLYSINETKQIIGSLLLLCLQIFEIRQVCLVCVQSYIELCDISKCRKQCDFPKNQTKFLLLVGETNLFSYSLIFVIRCRMLAISYQSNITFSLAVN